MPRANRHYIPVPQRRDTLDQAIRIMPCLDMQNGRVVKGVQTGYDLPVIRAIKEAVSADVVASGGAGELDHFYQAVEAGATILLAASVFHFGIIRINDLKEHLRDRGVAIR